MINDFIRKSFYRFSNEASCLSREWLLNPAKFSYQKQSLFLIFIEVWLEIRHKAK